MDLDGQRGEPRRRRVQCASPAGLHWMSYVEWGRADNPRVVVCVHGLTRCARDFDFLARRLAADYRVICPDVAGRGESQWLADPMQYVVPNYVADMVTLIARLDVESVDWVGTSMGGLIGLGLAAMSSENRDAPIRRLVLNDVGPLVSSVALARIGAYVGKAPKFSNLDAAINYVRMVSAPFGPHSDAQWRFLTEHVVRPDAGGGLRVHYDPAIAVPFAAHPAGLDLDLWTLYDAVRCPTLLMRGAESDLLSHETARAMTERGPRAVLVEFPGVGHAPTLIPEEQIEAVRSFLLAD